jgi:hypothetical protein
MSDETPKQAEQPSTPQTDIVSELNKLGENIGTLLKAIWDSDERKSFEREVAKGIEDFNKQIEKAAAQAKEDKTLKQAKQSVKEAWETAHGPQIVSEVGAGIAETLRALNQELAKRATRKPAQEVAPSGEAAPAESAPVPTEDKPPA